ncbi:hypothetical protein NCER_102245 [Vairimorpha ceranae BRL01]|uniref:Uncharacterized protein n=1 Tax=Vairimorpha ceranae (strain BRL01) TaxID=578460 RepID=C4VBP9_VAIC1|nr:hypothetical protein NCER_102245 [Vairimorpha ceranae BRL01]
MFYLFLIFYYCINQYETLIEESTDENKNINYMKNKFNEILNIGRTENLDVDKPSIFFKEKGKNVLFKNSEERSKAREIYEFYKKSIGLLRKNEKISADEMKLIRKEYDKINNRPKLTGFFLFLGCFRVEAVEEITPEDYASYKCCFKSMYNAFCIISSALIENKRKKFENIKILESEINFMSKDFKELCAAICDFFEVDSGLIIEDFNKYQTKLKETHVKYYKFLLYTEIKLKKVLVNDLNIFISLSEAEKIDFEMVINEYSIFRELYEAFKEYNFCMKPLLETFKVLVRQHISETEKFYKFTEFERNYLLLGIRK